MSILFTIHNKNNFFISKFEGTISDEEMFHSYKDFYQGEEWYPGLNELADLSDADLTKVTSNGVRRLTELSENIFKTHNITAVKTAIYAPEALEFGMSRIYSTFSDYESPEEVEVFKDLSEAKSWLEKLDPGSGESD